jgi:heme-degrading monooxygenase HmoA
MAGMLVQNKVLDFVKWKNVFDSQSAFRASSGALSEQVYQNAGDPNQVVIVFRWSSVEDAQKFAHSPELRAAMEKAGVDDPPTITFLNEA